MILLGGFNLQQANTLVILSKMSRECQHSVGLLFAVFVVIFVSPASDVMSIQFPLYSRKMAERGLLT